MSFSVFISVCLLTCAIEEDPDSKPLLDEVVAGAEANLAMIQFGLVTYKVEVERTVDPADSSGPIKEAFDASIEFDGERAHWHFKSINCLRDDESDIIFELLSNLVYEGVHQAAA